MCMRTCCFCFDLKHGTLAVGIFTVTTRMISFVVFATLMGLRGQSIKNGSKDTLLLIDLIGSAFISENIVSALFGALLIVGVQKTRRGLLIPWMVVSAIDIIACAYFLFRSLVYITEGGDIILQAFGFFVGTAFPCYMFWCVVAYYRSLAVQGNEYKSFTSEGCKEVESAPRTLAMQMPPPPAYTEKDTKHIA